jgi:protein-tyrosine phosphatase/dienelactone hydrolase
MIHDISFPMKCDCVIPHLFLGPAPFHNDDFQQLKALNITAILSLQTEDDGPEGAVESERRAAVEAGMSFTNLPVTDFDRLELLRKLPKCVATVERILAAGDTLYLHCRVGVNRSPTVAVAYLHSCLQWPLDQALEHIRRCRHCCPDAALIRIANIHFRRAMVGRLARTDDDSEWTKTGVGEERTIRFEINIHDCPESNVIIINYPGYQGDIDGYQGKYRMLADLIRRKGIGAVIRMDNQYRHGFRYETSVVADLKATIDYALANAESICSTREPELYLMGSSAGAGAIAIVAANYPQIKKVLLLAPGVDAGKSAIEEAFGKFRGEVYIAVGEDDECVGKEAGDYFLRLATGASKKTRVVIPNCDHQFQGSLNSKIVSKAPLWAFADDQSFPSPEGGVILYE